MGTLLQDNPPPSPILGGPGSGKTTLSLKALHDSRVAERFGARRFFVRCDGATTREALIKEVALSLGLRVVTDAQNAILTELARERAMLVLDNAETPWEAEPQATEELLAGFAAIESLALVATIRGNQRPAGLQWREPIRVQPLEASIAREVFLDLAGDGFRSDPRLGDLINACEGVPLAIVLMGYLAEGQPNLEDLRGRWESEGTSMLQRIGGKGRMTNFELSLNLSISGPRMNDQARRLLSLLGVLPDGIAWQDLESLLPGLGRSAAADLRRVGLAFDDEKGQRLRVLSPIREFVRKSKPPIAGDLEHCVSHFVRLIKTYGVRVGRDGSAEAIARLAPEISNVEAMITKGLELPDPAPSISTAYPIANLIRFTGLGSASVIERARAVARENKDVLGEAECAYWLGTVALVRTDNKVGKEMFEEALRLFRGIGNVSCESRCMFSLGDVAFRLANFEEARSRFEQALKLQNEVGDPVVVANCHSYIGQVEIEEGNYHEAEARMTKALEIYHAIRDLLGVANCTKRIGDLELKRDRPIEAKARYEMAAVMYRRVGDLFGEANCTCDLGGIALLLSATNETQRYLDEARGHHEEALRLYRLVGSALGQARCLKMLGDIALAQGANDDARGRYEDAVPLFQRAGDPGNQAECYKLLGDIALDRSEDGLARQQFGKALALYEAIPHAFSVGMMHKRLARLAPDADSRRHHVNEAIRAWISIFRDDLILDLRDEFGDVLKWPRGA